MAGFFETCTSKRRLANDYLHMSDLSDYNVGMPVPERQKKETASFETVSFCAVGERITHIRKALIINYLWHKKMKLGVK